MARRSDPPHLPLHDLYERLTELIVQLVGERTASTAQRAQAPAVQAQRRAHAAAAQAGMTSAALSLPPGPLGWLTVLPEMVGVWRIQRQLVADIAALYGQPQPPSREVLMYCLFRHRAPDTLRDLAVRVGERTLVKNTSVRVVRSVAQRVGIKLTEGAAARGVSRLLPLVGALGVGAYAWRDTLQVGANAVAYFEDAPADAAARDGQVIDGQVRVVD